MALLLATLSANASQCRRNDIGNDVGEAERRSGLSDGVWKREEMLMSILVGVYSSPDAARVEQDDETRRTIAKALDAGASVVGEFSCDGERLRRLVDEVSSKAWERASSIEGGGDCEQEPC